MSSTRRLAGIAGAPGIAVGPAWRYREGGKGPADGVAPAAGPAGSPPTTGDVRAAIVAAAEETARQLDALADGLRGLDRAEEAGIFDAQALMATDPLLLDAALERAAAGTPPAEAVRLAAATAADVLAGLDDAYLAARAADVRDVGARMVRVLHGETLQPPAVPSIAVADDLPPSVTAEIPPGLLLGIALEGGSPTAHAVILSRSLGIPAIVGVEGLLGALDGVPVGAAGGVRVALDGETGDVLIDPPPEELERLETRRRATADRRVRAAALRNRPCATADGERVVLVANIGTPDDAPRALKAGAEGVGLFRTEFVFMGRSSAPTEEEQVEAYARVLAAFGPDRPVVIRLADIGGDKGIPYLGLPPETNPFLGVRAIRLAYRSPDLLLTQLRAIWRAGAAAGVMPHVMAPMVATVGDVELLLALRDEAGAGVRAAGLPCAERLVTGIMVEVPAAAFMAPELARLVDFFSIGTNDLTQYTLAADRGNAALARLQDALDPAVLRAVAGIVAGADAASIPVAVCGELAGDPAGALVLVALGVDELSADAGSLDAVRSALLGVTRADLDTLARAALAATDARTVRDLARHLLARTAPD